MQNKRTILQALFLLGSVTLVASSCPAQTPAPCSLPPHLYELRKTTEPLSDAQREIDRTYVKFMKAAAQSYAQHNAGAVNTCCDAVKEDVIGSQFCALVQYLLSDRKESEIFLVAMPETGDQRKAFWFMEQISAGGTFETPTSLPGIPLPNGLLFRFVDEMFDLIKNGKASTADKYLFLYDDADGEFGEYMDDQLPKLFLGYPHQVLNLWSVFQKHRKRLGMLWGFVTERERKRIVAKYEGLCKPGDNRCAEVREVFMPR